MAQQYDIELNLEGETSTSIIEGRTNFEAMQRAIDALAADDRQKLLGVQIGKKDAVPFKEDAVDMGEALTNFETRATVAGGG